MRPLARPVVALLLVAVAACETVPITGRSQIQLLPESAEVQMGLDSYKEVIQKGRVSRDPVVNEQVARVGRRIAAATGRTDYQWQFTVLEDPQVNAFCLPGGKVAVYTGILPLTRDDAGLAAVLGHEVSHAIARHGGERISETLIVQTGLAATQAALSRGDPAMVQQVTSLLGAGATVGLILPWSRSQESEADHMGLIFMARAGYDPTAARDLWIRMSQTGGDKPPEYLSTHPSDATRIRQIEGWLPEARQEYRPR